MRRLLVASILSITTSQGFAMDDLSDFNWKNRVVLVFGDAGDQKVARQISLLERQKEELADRDMVVIQVSSQEARIVYGEVAVINAGSLKKAADVSGNGFHIVLVGKDGGVKLRSEHVVTDIEMFDLIDRMPMRRAERN